MKKSLLTIGLCAMFGIANAESDKSELAVITATGILALNEVVVLSQEEMQDTKAGAREVGLPVISEVTITKEADNSSSQLYFK